MPPMLSASRRHFLVDISKRNNFWLSELRATTYLPFGDQRGQQIPSEPSNWLWMRVFRSSNKTLVALLLGVAITPNISVCPSGDQLGSKLFSPLETCSGLPPSAEIT